MSGASPAEVDGMFWDEVTDRLDYWADFPPTHLLVRHALNMHASSASSGEPESLADVRDILNHGGR